MASRHKDVDAFGAGSDPGRGWRSPRRSARGLRHRRSRRPLRVPSTSTARLRRRLPAHALGRALRTRTRDPSPRSRSPHTLEAPARVPDRRLGAPENRVDARDQPLATGEVLRLALLGLAPVVARRMRDVQQPVIVLPGLHQAPCLVEEVDPALRSSLIPAAPRRPPGRGSPRPRSGRPASSCRRAAGSPRRRAGAVA